jgi:hypothetical protein
MSAHVWVPPALTATTPESPDTATGIDESVVVPLPTWPYEFRPQHRTEPPFMSTQTYPLPDEMPRAPDNPVTCTGLIESSVVPFPSWPEEFNPQHRTVVSPNNAHVEW